MLSRRAREFHSGTYIMNTNQKMDDNIGRNFDEKVQAGYLYNDVEVFVN